MVGHRLLKALVESQYGQHGYGDGDGAKDINPQVTEVDVVGSVAICPSGLRAFCCDEQDRLYRRVEKHGNPSVLEPAETPSWSGLLLGIGEVLFLLDRVPRSHIVDDQQEKARDREGLVEVGDRSQID